MIVACPDTKPWRSHQRHTQIDIFLIPSPQLPDLAYDDIPFLSG